jgi:hypothetical protein
MDSVSRPILFRAGKNTNNGVFSCAGIRNPTNRVLLLETVWMPIVSNSDNLAWFPSAEALNTDRFFLSFWTIVIHNQMVTTVRLIAYDREERMIYYAYAKW